MSSKYELAIALGRITLHAHLSLHRITIAVAQDRTESFSQCGGRVKAGRVNFYRENLFLPHTQEPFAFIVYEIHPNGAKFKVVSLLV
jgi:hypothetical protein